jgi:hypothetical protein
MTTARKNFPMTRLFSGSFLALALLLGSVALTPSTASAQEIQITGPLAGQPAVRRLRQYRVNRVQLTVPTLGYTLQDEFARSILVGMEAAFHFTDYFGIGVWGSMANFGNAFQIDTDLTSQVVANGQSTVNNRLSLPDPTAFASQVARLQGIVSVHAIFAPLRGKLSLFQGAFVDTDFYAMLGFALGFVEERADVIGADAIACTNPDQFPMTAAGMAGAVAGDVCNATQGARGSRVAPTAIFGVGLNLYFNGLIGMAIQWRMFPFNMNPSGTDDGGGDEPNSSVSPQDGLIDAQDQRFYFHHQFSLGLIINLPPEATISE